MLTRERERNVWGALLLGVFCLAMPRAAAAQSVWQPSAAFLQLGVAQSTHQLSAGLDWDWGQQWSLGSGQVTGYWEVSVAGWSYPSATGRRSAWLAQFGVVPVLRYRSDEGRSPWFYEFGIGATVTTTLYETERKRFSSNFNFGDHLAIGRSFGPQNRQEWALRLEHFSNGGIKKPNPGENFVELRYTHRFP